MLHIFILIVACNCMPHAPAAADEPLVLPIWPGKAAGDFGTIGPERVRTPEDSPTKDAKWITGVTVPTITIFRPKKGKNSGAALIVCPGGGYWNLAIDKEGEEVAKWFRDAGFTGIVLKYRVPRRPGQPEPLPAPLPLLDAQRAVSLVRSRAAEWGIDPQRIGMAGFSAGGHLVVSTAMNYQKRAYEPLDEVDRASCRPDFVASIYPGYLVPQGTSELADFVRIPPGMPPVFFAHAHDDTVSSSENSALMYLALRKAGVPAELHIYASGEHGFGVRKDTLAGATWPQRCLEWLRGLGILKGPVAR